MTIKDFIAEGEAISAKAGESKHMHGYFSHSAPRLHQCCRIFGLFSDGLGKVLELGPFYGYLPFMLKRHATSYAVLEGDDPIVYPLSPLYKEASIDFGLVDYMEIFGPTHAATHTLALPDASFDTILCWETMEHFNFNPVKFVRELYRVLKPGGRVCITVPNRASFQSIYSLVSGRGDTDSIRSFYQFEDYECNGKKAFFGFHWHEYSRPELAALFSQAGFVIGQTGTFTIFDHAEKIGLGRKFARLLSSAAVTIAPRYGKNVYLSATKPKG